MLIVFILRFKKDSGFTSDKHKDKEAQACAQGHRARCAKSYTRKALVLRELMNVKKLRAQKRCATFLCANQYYFFFNSP